MSVVVIGGVVLDVQAQPRDADIRRGSSVPGQVSQLPGGVGRNIAEAAHHLLQQHHHNKQQLPPQPQQQQHGVLLVSVVGQDAAADALLANCKQHGLSTAGIIRSSTAATPCVVAVLDRSGEVAACVADVAAPAAELTPEVVQQHQAAIQQAGLLVLDANLRQPALAAAVQAAAAAGVPVLFEPVSEPKSARCVPVLSQLSFITPNANELLAIAVAVRQQAHTSSSSSSRASSRAVLQPSALEQVSCPQQLLAQLAPAAATVLLQGLKHIILTLGHQGAALLTLQPQQQQQQQQHAQQQQQHAQQQQQLGNPPHSSSSNGRRQLVAYHIPAAPAAAVVNLSGAGDTLTGAFAAALVRGATLQQALATGVAAARLAVQCSLNVPGPSQGMQYSSVRQQAQQLLSKLQVWEFPCVSAL